MPHSPLTSLGKQNFRNLEYSPVSFRKQNVIPQHWRCQCNSLAAAIPLLSSARESLLDARLPEEETYHPHTQPGLNNPVCLFPPGTSEEKAQVSHEATPGRVRRPHWR